MNRILSLRLHKGVIFSHSPKNLFIKTIMLNNSSHRLYRTSKTMLNLSSNPQIPKHFEEKISRRLDTCTSNPIGIVSQLIKDFFETYKDDVISKRAFNYIAVPFNPVSISQNFDELQVPLDHVSRDPRDSYYLDQEYIDKFQEYKNKLYTDLIKSSRNGFYNRELIDSMADKFGHSRYRLLPTHTTSNITELLRQGMTEAIYSGQVFRRDEIDSQHYPVFHQLDGFLLFTREDIERLGEIEEFRNDNVEQVIFKHLKLTLENLVVHLFKHVRLLDRNSPNFSKKVELTEYYKFWDDEATFPFTFPSSEYYLKTDRGPIELLGCGVLKNIILENNFSEFGKNYVGGWAFGIGLERLSMVLCKIFDIRQFWETDERFIKQYQNSYSQGVLPVFVKYSKNPPVVRDLSFYIPESFDEKRFKNIIMENGKGYVEEVEFVSSYFNEKLNKKSLCYRVVYRAFDENLTNSFVNSLHDVCVKILGEKLNLTMR